MMDVMMGAEIRGDADAETRTGPFGASTASFIHEFCPVLVVGSSYKCAVLRNNQLQWCW